MAMDDVRIVPSNNKEISFRGELVAQASNDRLTTPGGERWFDLHVYKREALGFVPVIEYHSTHEGEDNIVVAEVVDRGHDVENFYFVFEPCEVFKQKSLDAMPLEERQRLTNSILKLYDSLVNRVLLAVKEHSSDEPSGSDQRTSEQSKKGLLGFLGLK